MTEKEFLISFIRFLEQQKGNNTVFHSWGGSITAMHSIDKFLEEHYKEYFENEYIKRAYEGEVDWNKEHPIEIRNMNIKELEEVRKDIKEINLTIPDPIDIQPQDRVVKDLFGNTKEEREAKEGIKGWDI
jgi:hypothetical protein